MENIETNSNTQAKVKPIIPKIKLSKVKLKSLHLHSALSQDTTQPQCSHAQALDPLEHIDPIICTDNSNTSAKVSSQTFSETPLVGKSKKLQLLIMEQEKRSIPRKPKEKSPLNINLTGLNAIIEEENEDLNQARTTQFEQEQTCSEIIRAKQEKETDQITQGSSFMEHVSCMSHKLNCKTFLIILYSNYGFIK